MLNSLTIKDFKILQDFQIDNLGSINFIVGQNNSGKSTLLEYIRQDCQKNKIPYGLVSDETYPMAELEKAWRMIALSRDAALVMKTLKIMVPDVEGLTFERGFGLIKVANHDRPMPLSSLGSGVMRLLQMAVKGVSSQGGILQIENIERSLHYEMQNDVLQVLLELARDLDVQIFATTHSREFENRFASVADENDDIECVLFRLGRSALTSDKGRIIATRYGEEELRTMYKNGLSAM